MTAPFLVVDDLVKRFGRNEALRGVSLTVNADELLVVLGPTGAGKTTLLRTIAGLEAPASGTISMAGEEITAWAPAARDVALVFQNFSLYPDFTVRRNMEFPLRAPGRRFPRSEIAERVAWAADMLRISHLLDRKAAQLSGGEMQRVAIGRAIVRRPKLFLMDEPLTNLDAKLREALRVDLACLRRELGTPMIFVTHDQAEALSMGDRITVLSEGRVLQSGSPREVYERPLSPTVALQLGQPAINLVAVRRVDGHWVGSEGVAIMPAADDGPEEATLGIRPEHVQPAGGEVAGTVRLVEDMGSHKVLLIDWAGHGLHLIVGKDDGHRPGDSIAPRVDAATASVWPGAAS